MAFPIGEAAFEGELAGIDREWNISFRAAAKVRVMGAGELAYWGRWSDVEAGAQVVLRDGGIVRADVLLVDVKQVVIGDATGLGRGFWDESAVPRETVRGIVFQPPAASAERDRMWLEVTQGGAREDRLLLAGGESVAGALISAPRLGRFGGEDTKAINETFEMVRRGGKQAVRVPAAKVVALQFADSSPSESAAGKGVWVGLVGGSLVRAAAIQVRGETARLALAAGGELKTTLGGDGAQERFWKTVTYLEPTGSRVAWLSDRQPVSYKHIPFVSVERPLGADQSVLGTRLRCDGFVFRKGIGMASASRAEFDVSGYRRFEAELAVDKLVGQGGSVVFKVELLAGDGAWQAGYESPVVRGGDVPLPIAVDLKGASRMALAVEFADRGDECDYGDWLAARLTK